jgi:hypothetical protein
MSRPLTSEEKCTASEDYFKCLSGILPSKRIRMTPTQAMNRAVLLILVLLFLHYTKIITLPLKFIPQMK